MVSTMKENRSRLKLRSAAVAAFALMISSGITPSQCFGTEPPVASRRSHTKRNFHDSVDGAFKATDASTSTSTTTTTTVTTSPKTTTFDSMAFLTQPVAETKVEEKPSTALPTWLRNLHGPSYEGKWHTLRESMMDSYYTTNEIERLDLAIRQASNGDREKMAGASEFCLILVETMEMRLNALIAAVFHFCSCVTARQLSLLLPPGAASSVWERYDHTGLEGFGEHCIIIADDAGRLKKLEMVANKIIKSSGEFQRQRLTPDSRDSENLKNLLLTETKDWRALAIRCAASLYRLRGILKSGSSELTPESVLASREAFHIYAPLASRLGMQRLKNELEGTAFRILYHRQYEFVNALAREVRSRSNGQSSSEESESTGSSLTSVDIGESMKQLLAQVQKDMSKMLDNDGEFQSLVSSFSVAARVKEPYSMWKKMLFNNSKHILQVPDAVALRIILNAKKLTKDEPSEVTRARERALCYYAQKLCKKRWEPMPGDPRFKDYIESPKANGYQSLHYTAITRWGGEDWPLEIQVRSGEMHKVAEFGLASHWDYKAQQRSKKSGMDKIEYLDQSTDAYLRSVQEWHWQQRAGATKWDARRESSDPFSLSKRRANYIDERSKRLEPYLEALTEARSDLARENVYIFLSRDASSEGSVLSVPAGACVLDALREAERQSSVSIAWTRDSTLVSCNGAAASMTTRLFNGDVIAINNIGGEFQ